MVEIATLPAVEQGFKGPFAPSLEGCLDTLRHLGPGWEGVVEELFEIPAQVEAEIALGTALDLERLFGIFAVRQAPYLAAVLVPSATQMANDECVHPWFFARRNVLGPLP